MVDSDWDQLCLLKPKLLRERAVVAGVEDGKWLQGGVVE